MSGSSPGGGKHLVLHVTKRKRDKFLDFTQTCLPRIEECGPSPRELHFDPESLYQRLFFSPLYLSLRIQEKKKKRSPSALAFWRPHGESLTKCKLQSWKQKPSGFAVKKTFKKTCQRMK